MAHDDWAKPRLHRDVAGLGLAGAVLAELVLTEYATIHDGVLVALRTDDPLDPIAARVMHLVRAEPAEWAVRDWLTFLARAARPHVYEQVAQRLIRAGHLRTETTFVRRRQRYVATDMNTAASPWVRISQGVRRGGLSDPVDTVLGGLILATDLHRRVLGDGRIGDAGFVETRLRGFLDAASSEVRELLDQTETAVGSAVITGA